MVGGGGRIGGVVHMPRELWYPHGGGTCQLVIDPPSLHHSVPLFPSRSLFILSFPTYSFYQFPQYPRQSFVSFTY